MEVPGKELRWEKGPLGSPESPPPACTTQVGEVTDLPKPRFPFLFPAERLSSRNRILFQQANSAEIRLLYPEPPSHSGTCRRRRSSQQVSLALPDPIPKSPLPVPSLPSPATLPPFRRRLGEARTDGPRGSRSQSPPLGTVFLSTALK